MAKQKSENFNNIKQQMFIHIYRQDNNFYNELEFFENLENNYDTENYKKAKLEIQNLMENYSLNNIILKAKTFKANYLPFFKGIPSSFKYKNYDTNAYYCLLEFEEQNFKFINSIIKEQLLHKQYYKIVKDVLENNDNIDSNVLFNSYITLKSIIMFQSLMDINISDFERYIDDFSDFYDYKPLSSTYNFSLDQLKLYFKTINKKKEKKKVKSLRY